MSHCDGLVGGVLAIAVSRQGLFLSLELTREVQTMDTVLEKKLVSH